MCTYYVHILSFHCSISFEISTNLCRRFLNSVQIVKGVATKQISDERLMLKQHNATPNLRNKENVSVFTDPLIWYGMSTSYKPKYAYSKQGQFMAYIWPGRNKPYVDPK